MKVSVYKILKYSLFGLLLLINPLLQARSDPPAGFPNEKNTGFVAGGTTEKQLESIEQDRLYITEDGFVLQNKKLTGSVFVKADNVTIKNCWIRGTQGFSIRHEGKNLSIEYCKLESAGNVAGENISNYKAENNYTLKYCDISGFGDGIKAGNDTLIEFNYIHDLAGDPEYHSDCIQVMQGKNIKIRNNTLLARWKTQTSVVILKNDIGAISEVMIEGNFMSGGAYVFYNVGGTDVFFKNNIIEKGSWQWQGSPVYPKNSPLVYECNRYEDGTPIPQNPPCKKSAEPIKIKPIAWRGHSAAVALTFDDAYEDHLDKAIPELNVRSMKGTFYLVNNDWYKKRISDWAKAAQSGHEIGNHSRDHLDPNLKPDRSRAEWVADISEWKNSLEKDLHARVRSYAHPYCNSPEYTVEVIDDEHFIGRECGSNFLISFAKEPVDWFRIEARSTTGISYQTIEHEVNTALSSGKWITYYFHSIAGPWGGFAIEEFRATLDFLKSKDVWVDTYSQIGAYLKASIILSKQVAQSAGQEKFMQWKIPSSFPEQVKVTVLIKGLLGKRVFQQGKEIKPNGKGYYELRFGLGEVRFQ